MPTPMRTGGLVSDCGVVAWCGSIAPPERCCKTGRSRGGPPAESDEEEACDERSWPQDVTSAYARHGGVNLQQEVEPQQTERPPRDSSREDTRVMTPRVKCNIQADRGGITAVESLPSHAPPPRQLSCGV